MHHNQGMRYAWKIVFIQLIALIILAILCLGISGMRSAASFIFGGLVNVLPNVCFARMLFKYSGALRAKNIVYGFYIGEATKLVLTFILFALIFKYTNLDPMFLFWGLVVAQIAFWIAPQIEYKLN